MNRNTLHVSPTVRLLFLALAAVIALAGCGLLKPAPVLSCADRSSEYLAQLDGLVTEFVDAAELALNTPRVSLAQPIADMQEIKREIAALDAPECASGVQHAAVVMAQQNVDAFMTFYAYESDAAVEAAFTKASAAIDAYMVARDAMRAGSGGDGKPVT
jgi:hypothetical protein